MAYCNSGCSGGACGNSTRSDGNSNYTRVGALGSLCRSGGCSSCSNCNSCSTCSGCGSHNGCNTCNSCNSCSGCGNTCGACGKCNACNGHGSCNAWDSCGGCGCSGGYRNPYYTGPCPPAPCNGCGCESANSVCNCCTRNARVNECADTCSCGRHHRRHHHHCICEEDCSDPCEDACGRADSCNSCCADSEGNYGLFAANGPLGVGDGGVIALTVRDADLSHFSVSDGCISIRRPGNYHVFLTVDIPTGMNIDTVIGMDLDSRHMELPQLSVVSDSHSATHNYAAHTVLRAGAGSVLKLTSKHSFTCPHTTTHPIVTLTITKVI